MIFPSKYRCLNQNEFSDGEYKIVPIRYQDRLEIMKWRNEQLYHLRQLKPLTIEGQDSYFKTVVAGLFEYKKPKQLLFSFFKGEELIGYGGLVHINWIDRNAEISFIMDTSFEKNNFHTIWSVYLSLIEKVAFEELKFHKLFVYAFDLRPHLYEVLKDNLYFEDAVLKDHCFFEKKFIDVVIHSKINKYL